MGTKPGTKSTNPNASPNSDSAEAGAQVTAAPPAPPPLISIALSDASALDNVKRRVAENRAKRGRSSLRIPLSTSTGSSGGIAIPS